MADIEKDVNEVVEDLKKKIDDINHAAENSDDDVKLKVNEIKDKAIDVLTMASNKVIDITKNVTDSQEVQNGINVVKARSKQLYENALKKIAEIKESKTYKDTSDYVNKTVDQVKNETNAFITSAKDSIDEFFEKQEVKDTIDKAKIKTIDIAGKALEVLKQWLKPEEEKK